MSVAERLFSSWGVLPTGGAGGRPQPGTNIGKYTCSNELMSRKKERSRRRAFALRAVVRVYEERLQALYYRASCPLFDGRVFIVSE